jgi:hypothetical protein
MKKRKGRGVDGERERERRKREEGRDDGGMGPREGLVVYVLWFFTTRLYGGGSRSSKQSIFGFGEEKKASFEFRIGSVIFTVWTSVYYAGVPV